MSSKMSVKVTLVLLTIILYALTVYSQGLNSGTVEGVVVDPNKAVVPNATVTIENSVTGYQRTASTESNGSFRFDNVPFNNYVFTASAPGFTAARGTWNIRSSVPVSVQIPLSVSGATETVTITGGELIENDPKAHVDVDKTLMDRMPVRDPGSGLSSVVTLSSPGVAADSNGGFHPFGDHFESNMSLDGQQIPDQQSKFFSTQVPVNAIQSMEIIKIGRASCRERV